MPSACLTVTVMTVVTDLHSMWTICDWIEKALAQSQKIWVHSPALTHIGSLMRVWLPLYSEALFIHL